MNLVFFILLALFFKHLICDFTKLQGPYQYKNKGTYGHPGGILHVSIHLLGTVVSLILMGCLLISSGHYTGDEIPLNNMFQVLTIEALSHYHMDWAKVKICKAANWLPTNSTEYWLMLGIDQFVHYVTYLLMAWLLV